MDPIRERIIQEIEVGLGILTIAGGFNSNCGRLIERGKVQWDDEDSPCMSIFPGVEIAERTAYGRDSMKMPLSLNAFDSYLDTISTVTGKPVSGASAKGEKILADLREAMRKVFKILTQGLVQDIRYTGGGMQDFPELTKKTVGVIASFEITYETKVNDPYNQ